MSLNAYYAKEYRQNDVLTAGPVRLIVMTFDVAIQACEQQNLARSTQAVQLLRDALDFENPEAAPAAVGFYRLYQWCLECIRSGEYDLALQTLRELREAWAQVEKRQSAPLAAPELVGQYALAGVRA